MSMHSKALEAFKRIGIELHPGGRARWENGKKDVYQPKRADRQPLSMYPNDEILKFRINDSPYLVIDADGYDLDLLYTRFPSIVNTFTTTTTAPNKKHFYVLPPEGKEWPLSSKIGVEGKDSYDLLRFYNIFESHIPNDNPHYSITANTPQIVSIDEFDFIVSKLNSSNKTKHYRTREKPVVNNIVLQQITADYIENAKTVSQASLNKLVKHITNQDFRDNIPKGAKKIAFPDLTHMNVNTMMYKLTYSGMGYEQRDSFINRLLINEYGIDPNSQLSKKHMLSFQSTLPQLMPLTQILATNTLSEIVKQTALSPNWGILKTIDGSGSRTFMEVDIITLEPRALGADGYMFFGKDVLKDKYSSDTDEGFTVEDLISTLPEVKLVKEPFLPHTYYDHTVQIDCLNMVARTEYYKQSVPDSHEPDNLIMSAIKSYYGSHYLLYMHFLAMSMYGDNPPSMFPVCYTAGNIQGGTGKTTVAGHIPTRLIGSAKSPKVSVDKSDFDVEEGVSLLLHNDVTDKVQWLKIYVEARNDMTGGLRNISNPKYGKQANTESAVGKMASMNFIPAMDELDRRCWPMCPQHLEGKTQPLTEEQGNRLRWMMEGTKLTHLHEELQTVANHLRYLWEDELERAKYHRELTGFAPRTQYFEECSRVGKTHSAQLESLIKSGPEAIETHIIESSVGDMVQLYRFLVYQYQHNPRDYVSLPWEWLAQALKHISNRDEVHTKVSDLALALKHESTSAFGFKGANTVLYRNDNLTKLDMPESWQDWKTSGHIKIPMDKNVVSKYEMYIANNCDKYVSSVTEI